MISFYNRWHLGDCIRQIHFQRHLSVPSTLWCNPKYFVELQPFIRFSSVRLGDITHMPECGAIDSWIGREELHTRWEWEKDFAAFYLRFLEFLAHEAGLTTPLVTARHLLLDGPTILMRKVPPVVPDIVFINSVPLSGQWDQDLTPLNRVASQLKGRVMSTEPLPVAPRMFPATCSRDVAPRLIDIARACAGARYVIGIDTGPMIPTFNIYSKARHIVLHNTVNYAGYPNTRTVKTMAALESALEEERLLL